MIGAKVLLEDDAEIASVWLKVKPVAGELLWFGDSVGQKFGETSFLVVEVAHWVSDKWSPRTHTGEPVHSLAIYVTPTPKSRDQGELS